MRARVLVPFQNSPDGSSGQVGGEHWGYRSAWRLRPESPAPGAGARRPSPGEHTARAEGRVLGWARTARPGLPAWGEGASGGARAGSRARGLQLGAEAWRAGEQGQREPPEQRGAPRPGGHATPQTPGPGALGREAQAAALLTWLYLLPSDPWIPPPHLSGTSNALGA